MADEIAHPSPTFKRNPQFITEKGIPGYKLEDIPGGAEVKITDKSTGVRGKIRDLIQEVSDIRSAINEFKRVWKAEYASEEYKKALAELDRAQKKVTEIERNEMENLEKEHLGGKTAKELESETKGKEDQLYLVMMENEATLLRILGTTYKLQSGGKQDATLQDVEAALTAAMSSLKISKEQIAEVLNLAVEMYQARTGRPVVLRKEEGVLKEAGWFKDLWLSVVGKLAEWWNKLKVMISAATKSQSSLNATLSELSSVAE